MKRKIRGMLGTALLTAGLSLTFLSGTVSGSALSDDSAALITDGAAEETAAAEMAFAGEELSAAGKDAFAGEETSSAEKDALPAGEDGSLREDENTLLIYDGLPEQTEGDTDADILSSEPGEYETGNGIEASGSFFYLPEAAFVENIPAVLEGEGDTAAITSVQITEGTFRYDYAYEVLRIVNQEREKEGLSALSMDQELLADAMKRSAELTLYFAHTRPDGSSFSTVLEGPHMLGGENIAINYSPAEVMKSWMNSPGHKANILREGFRSIGVGCFEYEGFLYFTQLFWDSEAAVPAAQPANETGAPEISVLPSLLDVKLYAVEGTSPMEVGGTIRYRIMNTNKIWSYSKAYLEPSRFTWKAGNPTVLSVDAKGLVTGKNTGKSTLSAATADGILQLETSLEVKPYTMYRLYNPYTGEHFYTALLSEKNRLCGIGWKDEGVGWYTPSAGAPVVYRLYNPKAGFEEHHYTADANEIRVLKAAGWNLEGPAFASSEGKETAVYRLFNRNALNSASSHHYTTDRNERDVLVSRGWRYEGIAWYGYQNS